MKKTTLTKLVHIMEVAEFRHMVAIACYEAEHGPLVEGMLAAVIRGVTASAPTSKGQAYERALAQARDYTLMLRAKEIAGRISAQAPQESLVKIAPASALKGLDSVK